MAEKQQWNWTAISFLVGFIVQAFIFSWVIFGKIDKVGDNANDIGKIQTMQKSSEAARDKNTDSIAGLKADMNMLIKRLDHDEDRIDSLMRSGK